MKRRDFIKSGSVLSTVPLLLSGQPLSALARNLFLESLTSLRPDRKLVLIQLNGGNDGLNTFVPLDQYDNLQKARSNIIIPQTKLVSFSESIGIHPAFGKIKTLHENEKSLLIQNVGYPQPNLSHFRSKDIVTSASAADEVLRSGWMGRMMNELHPDYPVGYPNDSYPHPVALTIGSSASQTCQGYGSNMSAVIKNINTAFQSPDSKTETYPETPFGKEMEYIAGVMKRTEVYLEGIGQAAEKAYNLSTLYPETGNSLSDQLKIVARLIAGGLNTQVYVVSLGGWDTHSDQAEEGSPENGRHHTLLTKLSDALFAFQDDLELLGIEDEVLGLVFTEFGRRIKSNASFGTDHGTAWPAIMFGSMVNPAILGSNPVIAREVGKKDNLPMQFDFRSVYASIFSEWFEADDEVIRQVLFEKFEYLPILKSTTGFQPFQRGQLVKLFPNPVIDQSHVTMDVIQGECTLLLYSSDGRQIGTLFSRNLDTGSHTVSLDLSFLLQGTYYIGLFNGTARYTVPFVKL